MARGWRYKLGLLRFARNDRPFTLALPFQAEWDFFELPFKVLASKIVDGGDRRRDKIDKMRIKRLVSFLVALVAILTTSIFCFGLEAEDVEVLVDGDYYERIMQEFREAEKSIYVEMYMVKLEDDGYVHNVALFFSEFDLKQVV